MKHTDNNVVQSKLSVDKLNEEALYCESDFAKIKFFIENQDYNKEENTDAYFKNSPEHTAKGKFETDILFQ